MKESFGLVAAAAGPQGSAAMMTVILFGLALVGLALSGLLAARRAARRDRAPDTPSSPYSEQPRGHRFPPDGDIHRAP